MVFGGFMGRYFNIVFCYLSVLVNIFLGLVLNFVKFIMGFYKVIFIKFFFMILFF